MQVPLIEFGLELGAEFTKVCNLEGASTEAAKLKIYGAYAGGVGAEAEVVINNEPVLIAFTAFAVGLVILAALPEATLAGILLGVFLALAPLVESASFGTIIAPLIALGASTVGELMTNSALIAMNNFVDAHVADAIGVYEGTEAALNDAQGILDNVVDATGQVIGGEAAIVGTLSNFGSVLI